MFNNKEKATDYLVIISSVIGIAIGSPKVNSSTLDCNLVFFCCTDIFLVALTNDWLSKTFAGSIKKNTKRFIFVKVHFQKTRKSKNVKYYY